MKIKIKTLTISMSCFWGNFTFNLMIRFVIVVTFDLISKCDMKSTKFHDFSSKNKKTFNCLGWPLIQVQGYKKKINTSPKMFVSLLNHIIIMYLFCHHCLPSSCRFYLKSHIDHCILYVHVIVNRLFIVSWELKLK